MWGFFVQHKQFTYVIAIAAALLGFVSMMQLPKESNPEITIPVITVVTPFPGASPVDVEQFVTDVIEPPLENLEDMKEVTSSSSAGASTVVIEFQIGVDIQEKLSDVREAVERVKADLPSDVESTLIQRISFNDTPVKVFALSGPYPVAYLRKLGEQLQEDLTAIPGVKRVDILGGSEREMRVEIDPYTLDQFGLSFGQVIQAIARANSDIPVGSIERSGSIHTVRFAGRLQTAEDIRNLPVTTKGGSIVRVRDVATVVDDYAALRAETWLRVGKGSSQPSISLSLIKSEGTSSNDTLDVVAAADNAIVHAQEAYLPEDIVVHTVDDFAQYIREDLSNLSINGLQTTLIVILLILLFLGWREALLAGIAIPMTFLITFLVLSFMGATLNFLSLFSLILALGILVDASIVVTEGIHEHVLGGKAPLQAALATIEEFKAPLISGTLTTIFAFVPMMLTSGLIGEFIKSIPITVSIVLFASLFVALALIPTFAVPLLTPGRFHAGRVWALGYRLRRLATPLMKIVEHTRTVWFQSLQAAYQRQLRYYFDTPRARAWFARILILAFIGSVALVPTGILRVDMFPTTDEDRLYVDVTLPVGTPLATTQQAMATLEPLIASDAQIESYLLTVGGGSPLSGGTDQRLGSMVLNLVDAKERDNSIRLAEAYEAQFAQALPLAEVRVGQMGNGPESGAPVEVLVSGPDLSTLEQITTELARAVEAIPGTRNVDTTIQPTNGEFLFQVDRQQAARYGVSAMDIASTLRTALYGATATTVKTADDDIDVIVQAHLSPEAGHLAAPRLNVEQLASLSIQTSKGLMPLSTFVSTSLAPSRSTIRHTSGDRVASVTSQVSDGFTAQEIFAQIDTLLNEHPVPDGYTAGFRGEDEELNQTLSDLAKAMVIGIFLIAALLVLQFRSYRQPLYVLTSIPLSLIGVLPGLAVIGQPLSFPGMIGVVALAGIVVNNGIILIDRFNENRKAGLDVEAALMEGCTSRLRPVILTTITTVAGMLPLVLSEPSWGPLGFAIIFGLLFSTILTLFAIPLLLRRAPV